MTAPAPPATSTRELDRDGSRAYGAGVLPGGWQLAGHRGPSVERPCL